MHVRRFPDRRSAGRDLGEAVRAYAGRSDVIVLALPRGGVPVGYELARAIGAPLDVFLVRKLGVPGHEELGFGALASGGIRIINDEIVQALGIDASTIERVSELESQELERREQAYRGDRPPPEVSRRTVILVDDGLATGSSMRVAIEAIRPQQPHRLVVAVPVAPVDTYQGLRALVDEVVCLATPEPFDAIGLWYDDFSPTTDDEVRELLGGQAPSRGAASGVTTTAPPAPEPTAQEQSRTAERGITIPADGTRLDADLVVQPQPQGLVLFAHGSGSGRHSPRNRFVAGELQRAGLATLLLDLLTEREAVIDETTGELRFDIALLTDRLTSAIDWASTETATRRLPLGLFGASTGAAAAIEAAARRPHVVRAIVSRGGRPDLAGDHLAAVAAPTLFIVGGEDHLVLELNRAALEQVRAEAELEVVEGATHLFEEPGALERVAILARDWFTTYLIRRPTP